MELRPDWPRVRPIPRFPLTLLNRQAYQREANALYSLLRFEEAELSLQAAVAMAPADSALLVALERASKARRARALPRGAWAQVPVVYLNEESHGIDWATCENALSHPLDPSGSTLLSII
jgi:hypothetical protein